MERKWGLGSEAQISYGPGVFPRKSIVEELGARAVRKSMRHIDC